MDAPIFEGNVCITRKGPRFEAKGAKGGLPRSFWETYSAFANTDGGTVVLGVSESDGTLVAEGVPDAQGLIDGLLDAANDRRRVSINLLSDSSIRELDVGGMRVVAVDVRGPSAGTGRSSWTAIPATASGVGGTVTTDAPPTRSPR